MPASNRVLLTDAKYGELNVTSQIQCCKLLMDFKTSQMFSLLTRNLLRPVISHFSVTSTSLFPQMMIVTTFSKKSSRSCGIISKKAVYSHETNHKELLKFPSIAKLLDPMYWLVAVAEEDVANDTVKAQIIKETKHIIEGRDNRGDVVTTTTTP